MKRPRAVELNIVLKFCSSGDVIILVGDCDDDDCDDDCDSFVEVESNVKTVKSYHMISFSNGKEEINNITMII
jgi:hypothetical protein